MQHLSRFSLFLLSLLLFPAFAMAQTGRVEGRVHQAVLGTPLPGINVVLEGTRYGTATAGNGTFALDKLPAGTFTLIASGLGFETARRTVTVTAGGTTSVDLPLEEQPIEISEVVVERVMLTGGRRGVASLPGSAHYISPQELEKHSYTDVHRVLREVPGINLQEEDGYGLRPNIGMRGTGVERSAKITVMEDGVLIAPAPYAAPAAYYFPTVGRMQAVEVRKGSSQIKYGPYTTGGALNLISTQIPYRFAGRADLVAGQHGNRTLHGSVGNSYEHVGFLLEGFQHQSDGFKHLDGGGATGFDKTDLLAKVRFHTKADARIYQALTFKVGRTTETSDETYLGLTDADFVRTPYRRYAGSREDVMQTEHRQYQARHVIRPADFLDVTTTLYRTTFSRNWYKLDRVRARADEDRLSIGDVLADPAAHPAAYAILTGETSPNANALEVKANNRDYYAQGIQSVVGLTFDRGRLHHALEVGARYHVDQIDRFQWVDLYRMEEGLMTLTEAGTPGTESNRVEQANAFAGFAQYSLRAGRLTAVPGLRYEHIRLTRDDYGKNDPARTGVDLSSRANEVDVFIPGLGLDYAFSEAWHAFGGIHKGFAPPGSKEGTRPEASLNYEAGTRYHRALLRAEAVFFYNAYSNLLGTDLSASGGQGSGNLFNGGAVDVAGIELSAGANLGPWTNWRYSLPVHAAYTFTDAAFQNAFESEYEPWGTVQPGDELPYLARHQLAFSVGLEGRRFGLDLSTRYQSRMRTQAGQGAFVESQSTDAHLVLDLAAEYAVERRVKLFASVRNLTDEVYVAARRPAGVRPGLPRTLLLGVKTSF